MFFAGRLGFDSLFLSGPPARPIHEMRGQNDEAFEERGDNGGGNCDRDLGKEFSRGPGHDQHGQEGCHSGGSRSNHRSCNL